MRKLVFGFGVYEKGKHSASNEGVLSEVYIAWRNMLERCYSPKWHEKQPTYKNCSVCDEWVEFQSFAEWYEENHPDEGGNCQLDKDLKELGNEVYSPSTCLFVSSVVNKFTIDSGAARGEFMVGVSWHKQCEKFQSRCRNPLSKKIEHLGLFTDEISAHLAWRKRKSELACELAMTQSNPEVRDALLRWKAALDNNEIHAV